MSKEVTKSASLEYNVQTLAGFLVMLASDSEIYNVHPSTVYVQDSEGNTFDTVSLVRETLTDGSCVYNIVLSHKRKN